MWERFWNWMVFELNRGKKMDEKVGENVSENVGENGAIEKVRLVVFSLNSIVSKSLLDLMACLEK